MTNLIGVAREIEWLHLEYRMRHQRQLEALHGWKIWGLTLLLFMVCVWWVFTS